MGKKYRATRSKYLISLILLFTFFLVIVYLFVSFFNSNKIKGPNSFRETDPYVHPSVSNIQDNPDQDPKTNKISIDLTEKRDQNDKITSPPSKTTTTNSILNSEYLTTFNKKASDLGPNTILLIICSNRPQYLKRTLDAVLRYHPRNSIPIVISEDGFSAQNKDIISQAQTEFKATGGTASFSHMYHTNNNELSSNGYMKLSVHYKWALQNVFEARKAERVIILEEDLEIAPDFFEFFAAVKNMVDNDESILCASAWNDNGFGEFSRDKERLYRSDFFPGLGWMMPVRIWNELGSKWPNGYWDDWLREPSQRKGRHSIRPEVCRTFHFGNKGVSNSEFSQYLSTIKLNDKFVNFRQMDLSYLEKDNWDKHYVSKAIQAPSIELNDLLSTHFNEVKIIYDSLNMGHKSFEYIAKQVGIMDNIKAMVPRTAYKGIVSVWVKSSLLHIVPASLL